MSFRPRFYLNAIIDAEPSGVAQVESLLYRKTSVRISEPILRLAQAEYDRQHPGQPYARMQERGGLGVLEIISLLADHCERLGGVVG